jgi:hypothetical protein
MITTGTNKGPPLYSLTSISRSDCMILSEALNLGARKASMKETQTAPIIEAEFKRVSKVAAPFFFEVLPLSYTSIIHYG